MGRGRILVYGLGVSGTATATCLLGEGAEVVAVDDADTEAVRARALALGIELVVAPGPGALGELSGAVDEVVVSPGIAPRHPVFSLGPGVSVVGEVELAARRARCPVVAVTGTNGKTTVTTLVRDMLVASGLHAVAGGNIGTPLLEALSTEPEVLVAEVSSFQLALTSSLRPAVGTWLNFSADHLDWHEDETAYRAAKARLWAHAGPGDVAVANAEDPVVRAEAERPRRRGATVQTFGLRQGDYVRRGSELVAPGGAVLADVADLPRAMPHDLIDALCAAATALAAGGDLDGCRRAACAFRGLPHRVELVGEANGVRFYDDSKATTPGAVLAALEGFPSAVLIAGGRNKGLDLSTLAGGAPHLRAVVAIGEAAAEVADAFDGTVPVTRAGSMADAVAAAVGAARAGDAVVLSPACASFDWYGSYAERGDDFARCVRALTGTAGAGGTRPGEGS